MWRRRIVTDAAGVARHAHAAGIDDLVSGRTTRGHGDESGRDGSPDRADLGSDGDYDRRRRLILAVIVVVLSYFVCRGVVKSRVGRSLIAIRDNETAAAVMGVHRARTKTLVYGLAAAMTAVAGALFGIGLNGVNPDSVRLFTLIGSITFVVIMVIGGGATLWGPLIGALVYVFVENRTRKWGADSEGAVGAAFGWLKSSPATFILAALLLLLMFVAPFGLVGLLKRLAVKGAVIVPSPAGTRSSVPAVEEGLDPSIDEPFSPVSTEETP